MRISEEVYNFNELLLSEQLATMAVELEYEADLVRDLCCLVLNQLPPRYIRHSVDVLAQMNDRERIQQLDIIQKLIEDNLTYLTNDRRKSPRD